MTPESLLREKSLQYMKINEEYLGRSRALRRSVLDFLWGRSGRSDNGLPRGLWLWVRWLVVEMRLSCIVLTYLLMRVYTSRSAMG